jgi:hypothetical protein
LLAIIVGLFWVAFGTATAADFEIKSFAVPVIVDTQPISSSMFLKCSVKEYNGIKLDAFRALRHDPQEDAFVQYITAVQNRDYSRFGRLSTPPTDFVPEPSMSPQQIAKRELDMLQAQCRGCRELT